MSITYCSNSACPMAKNCYRHEARAWSQRPKIFKSHPNNGWKCTYFLPLLVETKIEEDRKLLSKQNKIVLSVLFIVSFLIILFFVLSPSIR